MSSVTLHDVFWEIPLVTLGYLTVQAGRKAGIKGIGRMEKSTELWQVFRQKYEKELTEEQQRKSGKQPGDFVEDFH